MRFLANENIPLKSIHRLRQSHVEVISISEDSPGIPDERVMELAVKQELIILTFDRDYGELAFRLGRNMPPGIVHFRITPSSATEPAEILLEILGSNDVLLENMFTTIERGRIRQRIIHRS